MKKYKVEIDWYAQIRGSDEIEVLAKNEEEAEEIALDEIEIDYNCWAKVIDNDYEVREIEEIQNE